MKGQLMLRAAVAAVMFFVLAVQMPLNVHAAPTTFTVTVTTDDTGSTCADPCSLRQAITAANANPGADTIEFEIPAALVGGAHTIAPTSPLPTITEAVTIDATTDGDFVSCADGPVVVLDGVGAGSPNAIGIRITSGGSTVKGLVISRFSGHGIRLETGGGNTVRCNYVGTDVTGSIARGNQFGVVMLNSANNTIGGGGSGEGNVIAGSSSNTGLVLQDVGSTGNVVQGNLIGTAADGVTPLGNAFKGVAIISGASSNTIGGTTAGAGNVIAYNVGAGISLGAGNGNSLLGNSIRDNTSLPQSNAQGLGIDLQEDGVTANDAGDLDSAGPNGLQNYPIITTATTTSIDGTLDSTPGTHRLEFFRSGSCDPLGNGEGTEFLGALAAQPNGAFSFPVALTVGDVVTATATKDATGDTSEFSACATVADGPSLVVNVTDDTTDAGGCTLAHCSLREAINRSNATVGVDTITFNIPGAGPHTISPTTALPTITDHAIIDATSEPGSSCPAGLMIELDGTAVASGHGLQLAGSGTTVKGFVINRFGGSTSSGVSMGGLGSHTLTCSLIGTDIDGTVDLGNGFAGVEIPAGSNGNTIGGANAEDRNVVSGNRFGIRVLGNANEVIGNRIGTTADGLVALGNTQQGILVQGVGNVIGGANASEGNTISGNGGFGIEICCAAASGNVVQGNRIGTDRTGTAALPNDSGIQLSGGTNTNTIGGPATGEGNLISGNAFHGITVGSAGTSGNVISGNRIGTAADGVSPLGNQRHGVYFDDDASGNLVGGMTPSDGNLIAFNGNDGVAVGRPDSSVATTGISIVGNSIRSNAEQGIDLGGNGVTPNDPGDSDPGANSLQNFPVLDVASGTAVSGSLDSTASTSFRIEVFYNTTCDSSGSGEGGSLIGAGTVTTNALGAANFTIAVDGLIGGEIVTATATDPAGNTSEFSQCFTATANTGRIIVVKDAQPDSEQDFSFTAGGGLSPATFELDDNGVETDARASSRTFDPVVPGTGYSIVEAANAAWTSSGSCDDGSSPANISISAGETVTCTFVNRPVCVSGPVVATPVPADIRVGVLESNECMFLFTEQSKTIGAGGQAVNESPVIGGTNPVLPEGSVVTSYIVHFDDATNTHELIALSGSYPFPQPVLGVIFEPGSLDGSDTSLGVRDDGNPPTTGLHYERNNPDRGIEGADTYSIGPDGRTVTFNLQTRDQGLDNIRVVVGTLPPGRIIVEKQTLPDGSTQSFDFTASYDADGFTLMDGQQNIADVSPGTYTISEGSVSGWDTTSLLCDGQPNGGSVTVAAGQTVTCVFTNIQRGRIVIDKVTDPAGSPELFPFRLTGGPAPAIDIETSLADTTSPIPSPLLRPGDYVVEERAVTGWDLTAASCTSNQPGNSTDPASISLRPAEILTCTFTNTQRGRIVIDKVTNPAGSTQTFRFDLTGGPAPGIDINTQLADGTTPVASPLLRPGAYSLTERNDVTGWLLESAGCTSNQPGNSTDPASISLRPAEILTCTFTNTQRGRIVIDKVTNPAGSTQMFAFTVRGGPAPVTNLTISLADGSAPAPTPFLRPGTYSVTEGSVTGWDLTSASCTSNQPNNSTDPASLNLRPGEVLFCTFDNTQRGRIVIDKVTNPAGSTQSFPFRVTGGPAPSVNLTISLTDGSAPAPTPFLRAGTYAVVEGIVTNWQIESASCTSNQPGNSTDPASLNLRPGEVLFCTFTNRPIPITLTKSAFNETAPTGTSRAQLGDTITYTLTVTKSGPGRTSTILVSDLMLPRLRLENDGPCTLVSTTTDGTLLRCSFGSFSGSTDESRSVEFTARVILNDVCTVIGTRYADDLIAGFDGVTNGADVICGAGGADIVEAGGGNDTIYGDQPPGADLSALENRAWLNPNGDSNTAADPGELTVVVITPVEPSIDFGDDLSGGSGSDTIFGQEGGDFLRGNDGNDKLYGQVGDDTILGAAGNDFLYGDLGDDVVEGQAGSDYLEGNAGDDEMWGGDQVLAISDGSDVLLGGSGRDRMAGDNGKQPTSGGSGDYMNGGSDQDLMYGQGGNECSRFFSDHRECPIGPNVVIKTVHGIDYRPQMSGGADEDRMHGGSGDDRLDGGSSGVDDGNALVGGDGASDYCSRGPGTGDYRAASCELRPPAGGWPIPWDTWNWLRFIDAYTP